jgi:tetratricopeptide (TPR) repeat protein
VIESSKAVFLSYASQDSEAARRICEALRAGGVEVWFDQSELRGGDAWDQKIRRQIKDCALFLPLISAATQARSEGYFRLEWRLADQRTHLMGRNKAFIVPIAIDAVTDAGADVPESFTGVQWIRLPSGEATTEFCRRIDCLAGGDSDNSPELTRRAATHGFSVPRRRRMLWLAAGAVLVIATAMLRPWRLLASEAAGNSSARQSEAQRLEDQARELLLTSGGAAARLETAQLLSERAIALDPSDADALALASQADTRMVYGLFDASPVRVEQARSRAAKAANLAPTGFEPRLAQAIFLVYGLGQPMSNNAEPRLLALRKERPREYRVLEALGTLWRDQGRLDEAVAILDEAAQVPGREAAGLSQKAWALNRLQRFEEEESTVDRSISKQPFAGNIALKIYLQMSWHGDLDGALATLRKLPPEDQLDDVGIAAAVKLYRWRREPARVLTVLAADPRDWLTWSMWAPKAALTGDAHAELGQTAAARADWSAALKLLDMRLEITPNDRRLLEWQAYLKAQLVDVAGAREAWRRALELSPTSVALMGIDKIQRLGTPDEIIASLERRAAGEGAFISAADVRLNPSWDNVRRFSRFRELEARLDKDPRFAPLEYPIPPASAQQ